ncbi:hypothetical protein Metli_0770 [Methanofollis liminatans DSM 4140]|uniref:Uncharacterized protein n=1 Tax=Methanofollis liminatans DSM 4140 TaxID=28892 RepID=J1AP90_9EURY|nr:hypothetical protein [Methanofollis liminatans]EJG06733.1 hypothetical protein Metli_0770 [Methanofollis liminatans DSM 4140]
MSALKEHSITDEHGEGVAVILPLHEEEDLHDLVVAAERRNEPAITLKEMKKQIQTPDQHISRPTG